MKKRKLPLVDNCNGCGVCCLHMGYPAFILPREPVNIDDQPLDSDVKEMLQSGWTIEELKAGIAGEYHWHELPDGLRKEWIEYVKTYQRVDDLDGPCFWFDQDSRQCKNHQYRPQVCRDFETGSSECLQWRQHYQELL